MPVRPVLSPETLRWLPWVVAIAFFMQSLDGTILNTALPDMARDLDENPLRMQGVIVAYMLTEALLIPASGWIADRFGTKKIFFSAILLFSFGSLLCALSGTLNELIGARIIQGLGGALMLPIGRLVVLKAYPRSELVRIMGFITIPGLLGPLNDLMAWNADATRMPARMHSEYLRRLFLHNDLAEGRYPVDGKPISMHDLRVPVFAVGTVRDHVAPWRSAFKLHSQIDSEMTFVLTSGGHNAGIVSEPGRPRRNYQLLVRAAGGSNLNADDWLETAPKFEGSWWPAWKDWLQAHSGALVRPPRMGPPGKRAETLPDAPGSYVLEK